MGPVRQRRYLHHQAEGPQPTVAWTVLVGGPVVSVVKIGGKLPVNFALETYYNAVRPELGATWQVRSQVTFIF